MSKRYSYAKAELPADWAHKTAEDIKIEIKRYMLDSVLRKRKESVIWAHIETMLNEFHEEFDEAEIEIADGYKSELYDFAREAYKKVKTAIGNMPPPLWVASLTPPESISVQTKVEVEKYAQADFTIGADVATRVKMHAGLHPDEVIYSRATSAETYYAEVHRKNKEFMKDWEEYSKAKDYLIRVNPRNIAEMNVRFDKYKSEKQALIDKGVKLIFVPPHSNCSARCLPYQGRVYSLDGSSGSVDGRSYIPIEDAADNVTVRGKRDPSRIYYAGLFSYNCRHTMKEYQRGQNIEQIPKDRIERERKLEERQRKLERQIRSAKEKELIYRTINAACPNTYALQTARDARKEAQRINREYEAFSRKNGIPIYRERTRIITGEDIYARNAGRKDPFLKKL